MVCFSIQSQDILICKVKQTTERLLTIRKENENDFTVYRLTLPVHKRLLVKVDLSSLPFSLIRRLWKTILRLIDRSDRNPPITATSVTF